MLSGAKCDQPCIRECTIGTMKWTKIILLSLILVVGCLGWWLQRGEPGSTQQYEGEAQTPATVEPETDRTTPSSIDVARQRVEDASLALQSIVAQRKSAELEMQKAESKVEELERFIEDIEARGEDPVDFADEGLAKFQPAFYAYQDAFDQLELAETMEQAAAKELAEAEDRLAQALAP